MAAQMQININSGVSPDTVKLPPPQDVWESLQRRASVDPSPPKVSFDPSPLNVEVGDQIFWTNNDSKPHWPGLLKPGIPLKPGEPIDESRIDAEFFMPNQIAGASDIGPSASSTFSPGVAATLEYVCYIHRDSPCSVAGTINVT